jgi:LuxR family maltose regulon positive regulatory protein
VIPTYASGRVDTVLGWLAWFEDQGLVEHDPSVAVLGAWVQALVGRPARAERWADAAERRGAVAEAASVAQTPPDGSTIESYLAMLRGLLCRNGLARMRADARVALTGLGPASPFRTTALLLEGVSDLLDGHADQADPILAHAVELGTHTGALPAASTALAERCLVAIGRQDWGQAETLAEQALAMLQTGRLNDYIMSPLVHTVAARTALHHGDLSRAKEHLVQTTRLRPLLTYAIPSLAVQTLLELGRAYLALDDAAGARTVLRQAPGILQRRPDLGVLPDQAAELHAKLDTLRGGIPGVSTLTTRRVAAAPAAANPPLVPGDRPAALHLEAHGQDPSGRDLPQARRFLTQRGGPAAPRDRPPQGVVLARHSPVHPRQEEAVGAGLVLADNKSC